MNISQDQSQNIKKVKNERLPCRGCTRKCKNYDRCDGKPWRLIPSLSEIDRERR